MTVTQLAQGHLFVDIVALNPEGHLFVDCEYGNGFEGKRGLRNIKYHLCIWKFPEMELISKIEGSFVNEPYFLTWSPDRKTLYSCSIIPKSIKGSDPEIRKNEVMLWDTFSGMVKKHYIRSSGGSTGSTTCPTESMSSLEALA